MIVERFFSLTKKFFKIKQVDKYLTAPEDARIVLLLFNAGPLLIEPALEHHRIAAVLECFFPGQSTGGAIYKVLTGEVNPAGRLPNTWYADIEQVGI